MKVLLDACVWGGAKSAFTDAGHDAVWAGDWQEDPGDEELLAIAASQQRILITLDKDFGELVVVHGQPHAGIVRLVSISAQQQSSVCLRILAAHGAELQAGAMITAEPDRVRIRPPAH